MNCRQLMSPCGCNAQPPPLNRNDAEAISYEEFLAGLQHPTNNQVASSSFMAPYEDEPPALDDEGYMMPEEYAQNQTRSWNPEHLVSAKDFTLNTTNPSLLGLGMSATFGEVPCAQTMDQSIGQGSFYDESINLFRNYPEPQYSGVIEESQMPSMSNAAERSRCKSMPGLYKGPPPPSRPPRGGKSVGGVPDELFFIRAPFPMPQRAPCTDMVSAESLIGANSSSGSGIRSMNQSNFLGPNSSLGSAGNESSFLRGLNMRPQGQPNCSMNQSQRSFPGSGPNSLFGSSVNESSFRRGLSMRLQELPNFSMNETAERCLPCSGHNSSPGASSNESSFFKGLNVRPQNQYNSSMNSSLRGGPCYGQNFSYGSSANESSFGRGLSMRPQDYSMNQSQGNCPGGLPSYLDGSSGMQSSIPRGLRSTQMFQSSLNQSEIGGPPYSLSGSEGEMSFFRGIGGQPQNQLNYSRGCP